MMGCEAGVYATLPILHPLQQSIPPASSNSRARTSWMMRISMAILLVTAGIHPIRADSDLPLEVIPMVRTAPAPLPSVRASPTPTPIRRNRSHIQPTTLSWKPLHEHQPAQTSIDESPTDSVSTLSPTGAPTLSPPPTDSDSITSLVDDKHIILPPPSPAVDYPVQRLQAEHVKMTIHGLVLPLNDESQLAFETITRDTIVVSIHEILGWHHHQVHHVDLEVDVSLEHTWQEQQDGHLMFSVAIMIRSILKVHDLNRYIASAFNDSMESFMFLHTLKATGYGPFRHVVSVTIAPGTIVVDTSTGDSSPKKRNGYLLAAILTVVAAVAAGGTGLVVCLVQYIRIEKRRLQKRKLNTTIQSSFDLDDSDNKHYICSEIEIGSFAVEMSSLGDPSLIGRGSGLVVHEVQDLPVVNLNGESVIGSCSESVDRIDGNRQGRVIEDDDKSVLDATAHSAPVLSTCQVVEDGIWRDSSSVPPLRTTRHDARLANVILKTIASRYPYATPRATTNDTTDSGGDFEESTSQESPDEAPRRTNVTNGSVLSSSYTLDECTCCSEYET